MIARNVVLTMFKLKKEFSEMVTVGGKEVEFIEEGIFGHQYQFEYQGQIHNFYFDEPLKADTMNLVCRRLKDREMFVLEQIKGSKPPKIVRKIDSSNKLFNVKIGGERWNICCI